MYDYTEMIGIETKKKTTIHDMINFNNDQKTLVSIIVPVYNVETYLNECIDSLINQTLTDIEIICVNDGSTDNSLSILKEYGDKDKRVKIVDKENAGYGNSMNIGLDLSKGEYIGIVESDDYVSPDMYESLYNAAKNNDVDIVKSNFNRFKGPKDDRTLFFNRTGLKTSNYNVVLNPRKRLDVFDFIMNTWTGIYRLDMIRKNNIRHNESPGASFQDNGFYFQTMMFANGLYLVDEAYYFNRRDNENSSVMSTKKIGCMKDEYDFIQNKLTEYPELYNELITTCVHKRFVNYLFTYNRISKDYKLQYIQNVSREMNEYRKKGLIDNSLYTSNEMERLNLLMNDPINYHESNYGDMIDVSVIIPAYNEQDNIEECINSVLTQTSINVEVIIVDDGSTDNTPSILSNYKSNHNIKVLKQENKGSGSARNNGIKTANGRYIAFLDADDYYPSSSILSNLYIAAINNDAEICGGSFSRLDNGKIITKFEGEYSKYTFTKNEFVVYSKYQFDYGYHRFIYSSKLLKESGVQFPEYRRYQDPPFFVKAMIVAKKFYSISQVTYCYRKSKTKLKWTDEKVTDLLLGIRDVVEYSVKYQMETLHYNNVMRVNKDFIDIIMESLDHGNINAMIALAKIQSLVDLSLMNKCAKINEPFIIKPLYRSMKSYHDFNEIRDGKLLIDMSNRLQRIDDNVGNLTNSKSNPNKLINKLTRHMKRN